MNCREAETIIPGYLDGELDLMRSLELERHLGECAACAQVQRKGQSLQTTLAGSHLHFEAPKGLDTRLRSALRKASRTEDPAPAAPRRWSWRWSTILAPVGAAALGLLIAVPLATRESGENRLAEEIVSAHVRSLMLDHKTDVPSSDQHTVKPWFDGKLDFAPPVTDLAEQGFPLVGGRLDYVNNRPVAALVYQRRKHIINLFVWPEAADADTGVAARALRGYNELHWTAGGMSFWAVSDLSPAELREFGLLIKHHAG